VAEYVDFEDNRIKHLELIQSVVTRLAGNSFLIKGWAVTLTGAFLGFGVNREDAGLAAVAFVPVVFFCGLDAYYLWCERLFRELYRRVQAYDAEVAPFYMGATHPDFIAKAPSDVRPRWSAMRRGVIWGFYAPLALVTVGVLVFICRA
jgi:hypothetical protein